MKKLMILISILFLSIGLASCEDKKIESDLIIVVFFTSSNTAIVPTIEVEKGTIVDDQIEPNRLGYTFDGWYNDLQHTTLFDFSKPIEVSTTLYAKWIANVNVITYELDGGTNHPLNPSTFLTGQSFILNQPTRFDSTFLGWYLIPQNEVNVLVDRRINSTAGLAGDITLYALFEGTQHVVTFNGRGLGNFALPSELSILNPRILRVTGGALIPELPSLQMSGYTFDGWWDSTYTTQYKEDDNYLLGRSATFFAKWIKND